MRSPSSRLAFQTVLVLALAALEVPAEETKFRTAFTASPTEQAVVVSGSITDMNGNPVTNCAVDVFHIASGIAYYEVNEQKQLMNPRSSPDPKGCFAIRMRYEFVTNAPPGGIRLAEGSDLASGLALCVFLPSQEPRLAGDKNGKTFTFSATTNTPNVNAGTLRTDQLLPLSGVAVRSHAVQAASEYGKTPIDLAKRERDSNIVSLPGSPSTTTSVQASTGSLAETSLSGSEFLSIKFFSSNQPTNVTAVPVPVSFRERDVDSIARRGASVVLTKRPISQPVLDALEKAGIKAIIGFNQKDIESGYYLVYIKQLANRPSVYGWCLDAESKVVIQATKAIHTLSMSYPTLPELPVAVTPEATRAEAGETLQPDKAESKSNGAASNAQTETVGVSTGQVVTVAIVPVCLSGVDKARNDITVQVAEKLTSNLISNGLFRVVSQQDVRAGFDKANLSVNDVTGKTLLDLDKAIPQHDVAVFLGPNPGKGGWYPVAVARSSDFVGKSMSIYLGSNDTPRLSVGDIAEEAQALMHPKSKDENR